MWDRKYLNFPPTQATRASFLDPWQLWREWNGEKIVLLCPQKDTPSVVFWPWGGAERRARGQEVSQFMPGINMGPDWSERGRTAPNLVLKTPKMCILRSHQSLISLHHIQPLSLLFFPWHSNLFKVLVALTESDRFLREVLMWATGCCCRQTTGSSALLSVPPQSSMAGRLTGVIPALELCASAAAHLNVCRFLSECKTSPAESKPLVLSFRGLYFF